MLLTLNDYADPNHYSNTNRAVIAISDPDWRVTVTTGVSRHCDIIDMYSAPDLLPRLLDIPTFFIILDYRTYKVIEADLIDYGNPGIIENVVPILIYGVGKESIIQHPCLINGDSTHPLMVSSFFLACRQKARNS